MISNITYYSSLYANATDKWVVISSFNPDSNYAVRVENLATEIATRNAEDKHSLYATFALFDKPPSNGRGKGTDISAVVAVYLDMDVSDAGKYAEIKNRSMTLIELKALALNWGLPEPSAIVSSGRGYHFEYRLDEPFLIQNETDRARASRMLKGFNGYAIQKAAEAGLKLDPMGDLARVKRAVGSTNYRDGGVAEPVVAIELYPERTYSFDQLDAFRPTHAPRRREPARASKNDEPNWNQIVANDPFIQHCIANARTISYPEWFAALGIAARCENGRDTAHEFSRLDVARYKEAETDEKIDEALKATGAVTYRYIVDELGFMAAAEHRQASRLHSPLDFGKIDPEVLRLVNENVHDQASLRFYDLETLTPSLHPAFIMLHGHLLHNPAESFKKSLLAIKVSKADYLPGEERIIGKGKNPVLNVYQPPEMQAVQGTCDTIRGHFQYLIPNDDDRKYVLDYLAHMRQHPGVKINTALLFVGPQGNGKSLVFRMLVPIFGKTNVKTLSVDVIENRFQADRTNIQLLVIEELMGIDKRGSNSLKQWITADTMEVEEKSTKRFEARTPRAMMFSSNHVDAIALEDNERRFAAIQTADARNTDAYYSALVEAFDAELPAFAHWLDSRDITKFRPHNPAPQTALKSEIQKRSLSPLAFEIAEAMEERDGVFAQGIGTTEQVIEHLMIHRGWTRSRPTAGSVANVLYELGARNIGQKRLRDKGKPRLWAFRDIESWRDASQAELYEEYRPRDPFGLGGNVVPLHQSASA